MKHNPNDMLFPLMLLGDYMRRGVTPRETPNQNHPLIAVLRNHIPNRFILQRYIAEATQRSETMLGSFRQGQLGIGLNEYWKECLPDYCREHSTLHGLFVWNKMTPELFRKEETASVQHLAHLQQRLLTLYSDNGLSFETAEDILVMAGREIIDPNLHCFSPLQRSLLPPAQSTTGNKDGLPGCLSH